jgi:hypothetical protein
MLPWLILACKQEDDPQEPEVLDPDALAMVGLVGITGDLGTLGRATLVFQDPERDDGPREPEREACVSSRLEAGSVPPPPELLDAGDVIVRLDGELLPFEGGEAEIEEWLGGATVWFSASGGAFPEFTAAELLVLPGFPTGVEATLEDEGLLVTWSSPGDDAVTEISVTGEDRVLACLVEDDGAFLVGAEDLEKIGSVSLAGVVRRRTAEQVTSEVRIRGDARAVELRLLSDR